MDRRGSRPWLVEGSGIISVEPMGSASGTVECSGIWSIAEFKWQEHIQKFLLYHHPGTEVRSASVGLKTVFQTQIHTKTRNSVASQISTLIVRCQSNSSYWVSCGSLIISQRNEDSLPEIGLFWPTTPCSVVGG
jgi:hypothetical protein